MQYRDSGLQGQIGDSSRLLIQRLKFTNYQHFRNDSSYFEDMATLDK